MFPASIRNGETEMNVNTTAECVVRCVTAEVTGRTDDTGKKASVGKAEESVKDERMQMIRETDLTICGEGCSLGVVSCTPSDLKELTAGWLLTEGRISREDDIPGMIYDEKTQTMHVVFHGHLQGNHKTVDYCRRRRIGHGVAGEKVLTE